MQKDNPKVVKSWIFYDWANSVYALVISTAIFPIFYAAQTSVKNDLGEVIYDTVHLFGISFKNTELMSYVLSFSYLIVAIISPLLSGIADYTGNKLMFLKTFCYIGAISCMALFFFDVDYLELSLIPVLLASVGYWASLVFYNSYLPDISSPEHYDKLSARGFAMGYIGSVILLVANLVAIMVFKMDSRWSFISVGLWWILFAQIPYKRLPKHVEAKRGTVNKFKKGFVELYQVWLETKGNIPLRRYLAAFFVFSMGVQTVMVMAIYFGEKEILWNSKNGGQTGLIISVLLIQLIAVAGSHLHSWISKKIGNKLALSFSLVSWIIICFVAYHIRYPVQFYIVASAVGLVMGGIQALSRSSFSKLMPETKDTTSYFSFYDVSEKVGLIFGTFTFGFLERITGNMRNSVLAIATFFIVGLILLAFIPRNSFSKKEKLHH